VQLPAKPLFLLEPEEKIAHLEEICRELYAAYIDLSQIRIQYLWHYGQAYKASQSPHVGGRIQEAEIAAASLKEEELSALGQIDALCAMRDYLAMTIHD
jgi:hypothetical protein